METKQSELLPEQEGLDVIIESIEQLPKHPEDGLDLFIDRIKHFKFRPEHAHSGIEINSIIKCLEEQPRLTEEELEASLEHFRQCPKYLKDELHELLETFKHAPKKKDHEIGDHIAALKYLPNPTKGELKRLFKHLTCFPNHSDDELQAFIECIEYFHKRMEGDSNEIIKLIKNVPYQTKEQSNNLIKYILDRKHIPSDIQDKIIAQINRIGLIKRLRFIDKIKYLKKETQEEITVLTDLIVKPGKCIRVILFGSYPKGTAVIYDEYYENGILKTKQSDYDILVVIPNSLKDDYLRVARQLLEDSVIPEYDEIFKDRRHAPPQFLVESESKLRKNLLRKQVFFTEIVTDGIVLYDNAKNALPEVQELSYKDRRNYAQLQFDERIQLADERLFFAGVAFEKGWYKTGAFDLHQACEHYYHTMGMVYDNNSPKEHDLKKLIQSTRGYSSEIDFTFPTQTTSDNVAFEMLWLAYSHARYDLGYQVTKEQYEYMLKGTEKLKELAHRLCNARLEYYDVKIKEEGTQSLL